MQSKKPTFTAIIITKNEEEMIANCLEMVKWCSEILVIDQNSDDRTMEIAKRAGARVLTSDAKSFAELRNLGWHAAQNEWLVYVDADERISPRLAQEIEVQAETGTANALQLRRESVMYGKQMLAGGWTENIVRVFRKETFQGWFGEIHESPSFLGESTLLNLPLLHFTHRNTLDGLVKSASWTPMEAKLFIDANTPPVSTFTILRKILMEFFRRLVIKGGYKDGTEGWIESIIQGFNRGLVYIQIWELQQKPSLPEKYHQLERELMEEWRKQK
jgi:(heptosyl)LPS beta-1,4-glucosyltransferase